MSYWISTGLDTALEIAQSVIVRLELGNCFTETMPAKMSSKGQIVIPKQVRDRLRLKPGDKVRLELVEGRGAFLQPTIKPPSEIFVESGSNIVEKTLDEGRKEDETKIANLLRALCAGK